MAAAEAEPPAGEPDQAAEEKPPANVEQMSRRRRSGQLTFEGMPVTSHKVQIGGSILATGDLLEQVKIGNRVRLVVDVVVTTKTHKAPSSKGEPTGELNEIVHLHVYDASRAPEELGGPS